MRSNFTTSPIVSELPQYVEINKDKLITKAVVGSRSRSYVTLQTGVKKSAQLNLLNTSIAFREQACSFDATSSQTLSMRVIECGNVAINILWCDKQLLGKWAEYQVKIAANKTEADLPFAEYFINAFVENIQIEVDKAFWMANKTGGWIKTGVILKADSAYTGAPVPANKVVSGQTYYKAASTAATENTDWGVTAPATNLSLNEGIITLLAIEASKGTITEHDDTALATKIAQVNDAIVKLDRAAKEKGVVRVYMAPEYYEAYMMELVQANLYHYNPGQAASEFEYMVPGTRIIATSCPGLIGAKHIVAANEANLFWGCDLEGDQETFDVWYSKDDRNFKGVVEFNIGAQVAFPDQVAFVKVAA